MKARGLTKLAPAAITACMQCFSQGAGQGAWWFSRRAWGARAMLVVSASWLSGCISVTAPDKPIVIELNINIKQEVIYRLAEDADKTIESNPGIF